MCCRHQHARSVRRRCSAFVAGRVKRAKQAENDMDACDHPLCARANRPQRCVGRRKGRKRRKKQGETRAERPPVFLFLSFSHQLHRALNNTHGHACVRAFYRGLPQRWRERARIGKERRRNRRCEKRAESSHFPLFPWCSGTPSSPVPSLSLPSASAHSTPPLPYPSSPAAFSLLF